MVHVPPQYVADSPTPVVLAFHGGGANAHNMVGFSGLNHKADQSGFIAVYPEGTGRLERMLTFNAGNCCGQASARNVDDVAFVRHVLDDLEGVANVDRRRVFATGMSNAMMAYRLASEMSDRIAAIAPVSGPMGTKDCRPGRARARHALSWRCRRVRPIFGRQRTRANRHGFLLSGSLNQCVGGCQRVQEKPSHYAIAGSRERRHDCKASALTSPAKKVQR